MNRWSLKRGNDGREIHIKIVAQDALRGWHSQSGALIHGISVIESIRRVVRCENQQQIISVNHSGESSSCNGIGNTSCINSNGAAVITTDSSSWRCCLRGVQREQPCNWPTVPLRRIEIDHL